MAKSSRSSSTKANKSKLRSRIFGPIEDARTQRLSARLLHLASQPKPTETDAMRMDIEQQNHEHHKQREVHEAEQTEGMEIDGVSTRVISNSKSSNAKVKPNSLGKVQKNKRRGKASASIVFPSYRKGKLVAQPRKQKK